MKLFKRKKKRKEDEFKSVVSLDIGIKDELDPHFYIEGEIRRLKTFNLNKVISALNQSLLKMFFNKEKDSYSDYFFNGKLSNPDDIDWEVLLLVMISKLEFYTVDSLEFYSEEQKQRLNEWGGRIITALKANRGSKSPFTFPDKETNQEEAVSRCSIFINELMFSICKEGRILLAELQHALWD